MIESTTIELEKDLESYTLTDDLVLGLSRFQQTLLSTNGTVTHLLERYVGEQMQVFKLEEHIENRVRQLPADHRRVVTAQYMPVLSRAVLLRGERSLDNWIYANSSILLNHLPSEFRLDLFSSYEPIGKLWEKYAANNTKTILSMKREPARELAEYFNIQADDELLSRTYQVQTNGQLTVVISEKFPVHFFI